jgi:hypothetical protein
MKRVLITLAFLGPASSAQAESCRDRRCAPMTAKSICEWTRNHPIDRPKLHDDDLQAVMFDSCIYFSRIECAYVGESTLSIFNTVFQAFTGDERRGLPTVVGFIGKTSSKNLNPNIFDNFAALQTKHSEVFMKIEKLQADFLPIIDTVKTIGDAKAARAKLRERSREIQAALLESSYYDSVFLKMLEDAGGQLLTISGTVQRVLNDANCKVLNEPLGKLSNNAQDFFMRLDELRKYGK